MLGVISCAQGDFSKLADNQCIVELGLPGGAS